MDKGLLLWRLDEIGRALAAADGGLALIGVGSVGVELERLDAYSDLDFFAIVKPGHKQRLLDDLDWLSSVYPLEYVFRNTVDGYKLLFRDGIFCEMAIFEEAELLSIPFAEGRIVWKAEGVDDSIRLPKLRADNRPPASAEFLLGEALTCLYVGMMRYQRGEKLSAQRFIQHYAVDRVIDLCELQATAAPRDPFAIERRFERRHPQAASRMPEFIQGYERSPQSAEALLEYLDETYGLNAAMRDRVLAMCRQVLSSAPTSATYRAGPARDRGI
jgi:lincosamide nucleotidyltransferase B/F